MNRSAQPLPFDARTKDGDESIPSQRISSKESVADVLRPVVVADGQAGRGSFADGSESLGAPLGGSVATLRSACLVRRSADPRKPPSDGLLSTKTATALSGSQSGRGHVGAPHLIDL